MGKISYNVVEGEEIKLCRELCNDLMAYQKAQAKLWPERFDGMNFDTRMKKSFLNTPDSQTIVAFDNGIPIGYIFSTIENISHGDKSAVPDWAPPKVSDDYQGFYPDWDELPARCGCLNNLYIKPEYQHQGIGVELFKRSMEWMASFSDVDTVFVYISNGNDNALNFYLRHGFIFSHNVFGGFIKAAYYKFDKL